MISSRHATDMERLRTADWMIRNIFSSDDPSPRISSRPGPDFHVLAPGQAYTFETKSGHFVEPGVRGSIVMETVSHLVSNWSNRTWRTAETRWRQIGPLWRKGYRATFKVDLPSGESLKPCYNGPDLLLLQCVGIFPGC